MKVVRLAYLFLATISLQTLNPKGFAQYCFISTGAYWRMASCMSKKLWRIAKVFFANCFRPYPYAAEKL